ncbi:MAG: dihydrofolate reductase [Acidobacteria bacterium]|nr:dihydrofolate reductase [Acidobacteriota bacterium]
MSRLTLTAFVSLDGIMQAPGGPGEDQSGGFLHGGWVIPHIDEDFGGSIVDVYSRAGGFLLGRGTYEIFASHWPRVTDPADPIAGPLNRLPKYVASRTLERADWSGSTVVRDIRAEVARFKGQDGPEIQVHGSPGLVQTLLAYELIDELHLFEFPVVLGSGKRLFGPGAVPTGFEALATRTTSKGVVIRTLRPAGRPMLGAAPGPE